MAFVLSQSRPLTVPAGGRRFSPALQLAISGDLLGRLWGGSHGHRLTVQQNEMSSQRGTTHQAGDERKVGRAESHLSCEPTPVASHEAFCVLRGEPASRCGSM